MMHRDRGATKEYALTPRSIGRSVTLCVLGLVLLRPPVVGQELRGRVLEAGGERRVGQALVRLLDIDEVVRGTAVSDSAGTYSLSTPGPGDYRLTVEEIASKLGGDIDTARVTAYQVVCLVEQNVVMQRLGFDPGLNDASRRLAQELIRRANTPD